MRFFPGPQGPCVRKICFWCGPASAPEFSQPTLPVQTAFPLQGGRWHGEAVTDEGNGFVHPRRPVRAAGPVNYLLSRSRSSGTTNLGVRPEK